MKKYLAFWGMFLLAGFAFPVFLSSSACAQNLIQDNCTYRGIPLYGKVKIVDNFADIKVKCVRNFPDLRVKFVDNFADHCGEWQIVENFPDFTVEMVEHFGDIEIELVSNFPGLN